MNWNSNDTKYIIKRFIIYILICFAMFIIGTWKAKAMTDSFTYGQPVQDTIGFSGQFNRFKDNFGGRRFENYKDGEVYFTFSTSREMEIYGVKVYDGSNRAYPCDIGTTTGYNDNNRQVQTFSAKCKSDYINTYFNKIEIYGYSQVANALIIWPNTIAYYSYDTPKDIITAIQNSNNGAQAHQDAINTQQKIDNVNNSINNDNVTTSDADDFTNNQAFNDSTGLESVIQLPLNMINSLTSTCQPIQVTIPFIDYTGEIPCMSTIYKSKFNTLYTIVKIVINGFFVYRLLLKIYELVHNAKQPDEDKLEVIEL